MKPILFNTEMVRAILDGRKIVTRRVVKIAGCKITGRHKWADESKSCTFWFSVEGAKWATVKDIMPPYKPGDILYVRETWAMLYYTDPDGYTHFDQKMYYYAADGIPDITLVDGDGFELDDQRIRWRPSIHMPKEIARIFLRVKRVHVERLQDITAEEAKKEGCTGNGYLSGEGMLDTKVQEFAWLWDRTIKPADRDTYGWSANPWVWVIDFERISYEEAVKGGDGA